MTAEEFPYVHDPVIAKEKGTYYVFSTGPGIPIVASNDRRNWRRQGRVFDAPPAWAPATIPGFRDYEWAPDISFFAGRWHLYYSVSTFGSNHSAIGLATNATLDPSRADYAWRDDGMVIESHRSDDWNAIDPNVGFDAVGTPYLTFGSFWSGIKLLRLDRATGKPVPDAPLVSLASRPHTPEIQGAVEAPFMWRHDGWFYLFVSWDFCCRGVRSTYNVRVGRSRAITGPYVDAEGKPMTDGGGTLVVSGRGRWRGTGHCAVFRDGGTDLLLYHAYDAEDNGRSKLRIEPITWDKDGWPQVPSMAAEAAD